MTDDTFETLVECLSTYATTSGRVEQLVIALLRKHGYSGYIDVDDFGGNSHMMPCLIRMRDQRFTAFVTETNVDSSPRMTHHDYYGSGYNGVAGGAYSVWDRYDQNVTVKFRVR